MKTTETPKDLTVVCFRLDKQRFGIPISHVKEIVIPPRLTPIFQTPPLIAGVVNLRGSVIMVLDLKKQMGYSPEYDEEAKRIVIVDIDGRFAGFLVNGIDSVIKVEAEKIESLEDCGLDKLVQYCSGIVQFETHSMALITIQAVLDLPEVKQFG